ncbi:MAG: AAA family ATPase [Candidatus Thorarchaeota archaeon]|jgi:hypothetical protein
MTTVADLIAMPPKILIYSRAGLAKTALALTLGDRCKYHDLDDNLEVAFGLKDQFTADRQCVDVEQFLDPDPTKANAFMRYKKALLGVANECNKGTFALEAYVLDSLTSLASAVQNQIMGNAGKLEKNPEIQHWGLIITEIERVVTWIKSLPIPAFILAHETTFVTEDHNEVQISIPGQKLPGKITRMFSEIWYIRAKATGGGNTDLYIQTVPTQSITCRSGRGLPTGTRFATIQKDGSPKDSVGLWELMDMIDRKEKTPK